jgi:hypothetical protein
MIYSGSTSLFLCFSMQYSLFLKNQQDNKRANECEIGTAEEIKAVRNVCFMLSK